MRYKRIAITCYGGPEELRVVEAERPLPQEGKVRVRVLVAGVSLPNRLTR